MGSSGSEISLFLLPVVPSKKVIPLGESVKFSLGVIFSFAKIAVKFASSKSLKTSFKFIFFRFFSQTVLQIFPPSPSSHTLLILPF